MTFCFFLNFWKCFLFLLLFTFSLHSRAQQLNIFNDGVHQKNATAAASDGHRLLLLSQMERSAENSALVAETDFVDPLLPTTDRRKSDAISGAAKNPAHYRPHQRQQSKNLVKKRPKMVVGPMPGKNKAHQNGQQFFDNNASPLKKTQQKKGLMERVNSFFARVRQFDKNQRIVKLYLKLRNAPGGWGELVRKMYTEMLRAKQLGIADNGALRENCRRALQLIGKGRGVQRTDVSQIKPFLDFWTLLKSSARSMLALFIGRARRRENGGKSGGRKLQTTTNALRAIKTFTEANNSFFTRLVQKGAEKMEDGELNNQRRRHKRLVPLIILGIIIGGLLVLAFLSEMARAI